MNENDGSDGSLQFRRQLAYKNPPQRCVVLFSISSLENLTCEHRIGCRFRAPALTDAAILVLHIGSCSVRRILYRNAPHWVSRSRLLRFPSAFLDRFARMMRG
jgi:hypothetical protein